MRKKTWNLAVEATYLFSSCFMILLLLIVLTLALPFWSGNKPPTSDVRALSFWILLMVAIITSVAQWVEGRIKSIIKSVNKISEWRDKWQNKKKNQALN